MPIITRITLLLALVAAALMPAACDDGNGDADADSDTDTDSDSDTDTDTDTGPCEMPAVQEWDTDSGATKFALTMFHYNIEYVAGGLEGWDDVDSFCGETCEGWDNQAVEDWIVRETFAPVVEFYHEHPDWGVNFEMQAYMLHSINERFPELMPKLREMVARGQLELSSIHWADQLFLAYPLEDLQRSNAMTKSTFEDLCMPLSGVVFNQEGQAGEGRQKFLAEHGYTIGVFPKNLFRYVRDGEAWWPYYTSYGQQMIVGPGAPDPAAGIEVDWLFFDDGELLAISGLGPYAAPIDKYLPSKLRDYEQKLQASEAAGYRITTISDYVKHLQGRGVEARPAPPLLDGTWQPPSTDSIHRWLGGLGDAPYSAGHEQDNKVRTGNYRARTELKAADVLYEHWKAANTADAALEVQLADGWRTMMHAEVSDGSGVNPWAGEIRWCLLLNDEVIQLAEGLISELKTRLSTPHVMIDLSSETATPLDDLPLPEQLTEVASQLAEFQVIAAGREQTVTWREVVADKQWRIEIALGAVQGEEERTITAEFPWYDTKIVYSPGLMDETAVEYDRSEFSYLDPEVYLPLPNGLIGLGNDFYAIKHTHHNHIAARMPENESVIQFIDETAPIEESVLWFFDVFKGDRAEALAAANRLNIKPVVYR